MRVLGNILWIFLGGGIFLFLGYIAGGLALCITIIGIPFGLQQFKLALLSLTPFGMEVRTTNRSEGCLPLLLNIIWLIFGGFAIVIVHLVFAFLCAITIIGIPFTVQHIKLVGLALTPFGKELV